jgi:enoyl-CoA hydratase/carnithine racemase
MRYIFTSEFINAKRAYELGVVSEVYKTDELHSKVIELANEMANKPITALKAAKKVIKEAENLGMRDGVALERKLFYPLYDTKGTKEGVGAFVEKRKPNMLDL